MTFGWSGEFIYSPTSLECVCFGLLYPSLIFDMFIVVCVCVRTRVCVCVGVGMVLGSIKRLFFLSVWACVLGGFVFWAVVLNLLVVLSLFLYTYTCLCIYIYIYMYVWVCLGVFLAFFFRLRTCLA